MAIRELTSQDLDLISGGNNSPNSVNGQCRW